METQENKNINPAPQPSGNQPAYSGRALAGMIIVLVGGVLLAKKAGVDIPYWVTSFPMLLIAIGLFIGAKHRFSHWGWLIPVGIGLVFLTDDLIEDISIGQFIWPVIIIGIGLVMIFRPKRNRDQAWKRWHERRNAQYTSMNTDTSAADTLDAVTIFGGTKKMIISKNFQGGEAVTIFGGVEVNLAQADLQGRVELELVQAFGGAKLVVPSNWTIQTDEMVCIFGGLDDKRNLISLTPDANKVLVLKGTCIFGGIDIKSY